MMRAWNMRFAALSLLVGLIGLSISFPSKEIASTPLDDTPPSEHEFVPDEIIVAFDARRSSARSLTNLAGASEHRRIGGRDLLVLKVPAGEVLDRVQALEGQPGVRFAEPNWIAHPLGDPDPDLPKQWALHNPGPPYVPCDGSDCPIADADIDWPQAVMALEGAGFSSATVAIIDTGIDLGHPDLIDRLVPGWDFIHDDPDPDDEYGHGTHVAGIAAASTFNDLGVGGVAFPETVRIMPLKVCDASGNCPDSAIAAAILWAADHRADVINMSLGHGAYSDLLQEAVDYAWERGVVPVAAAGNDAQARVDYPAALNQVVAVGNRNWWDQRSRYSNWGAALDLVAPGGDISQPHDPGGIFSTTPTYPVTMSEGGWALRDGYDFMSGTSMASPHVAGLAVLLRAIDPDQSPHEIVEIMQDSADDLDTPGCDLYSGFGRINVCRAVGGECGSGDDPPLPPHIWPPGGAPTPTPTHWNPIVSIIRARADDTFAYYSRGWVNAFDWEDIILAGDTWAGLRFTDLVLPMGAEIVSASLEVDVFGFDDPRLLIYAEAGDQPADFSRSMPMERTLTDISVGWTAANIGGGWGHSPDIAPLLQAVVERPGWESGDPIALILRNDGGQLRFRSWDYGFGRSAPRLHVVYATDPSGTASPTPAGEATSTPSPPPTAMQTPTLTASPSLTFTPTTPPTATSPPTSTPSSTAQPSATATPFPTWTRTASPTLTAIPPSATASQGTGQDPDPVSGGEGNFYLSSRENTARGAYWMAEARPEGEYASAWEDAQFYSGTLPTGAAIPPGTTTVCLNYVNSSGSTRRVEITLEVRGDSSGEALIDAARLWLSPSYGLGRRCLRASTEAYTIGPEAEHAYLWLELQFPNASTSTRILWDGRWSDSAIMLPWIEIAR